MHEQIELTVEIFSMYKKGHLHPIGTKATVVELLGDRLWMVEIRIPDMTYEGDAWYETIVLHAHEFRMKHDHA